MAVASVADFFEALRESQLLEPAHVDEILQASLPNQDDPQILARELVQRGVLTAYQAEQLLQDRGKELILGPYRLLEPLGEGGMGQVFKALQSRLNRVVALKVIRQDRLSRDAEAVKRFQREARAAAQLSHPNVVIVYDADQVGDRHYIAMEYVDGTDLARLVKEHGPLPVSQASDCIRQAALGLQHAFERGMVHRDIKPSNLLVTVPRGRGPSGTGQPVDLSAAPECPAETITPAQAAASAIPPGALVKILDMGLARVIRPESETTQHSLTQEGTVMGTPDYIAPEQARDARQADIRADLYSLGCTLYFLLTGQPPFPQGAVIEKLLMHQLDEPRPVESLRPDVPASLAAVLQKLISKRPEDRYQTPAEAAAALERAAVVSREPQRPVASAKAEAEPAAGPGSTAIVDIKTSAAAPPEGTVEDASEPTSASYYKWGGREDAAEEAGIARPRRIGTFRGHRGWVTALAFSPDRNVLVSGGVDASIRLWTFSKTRPRDLVFPPAHRGEVNALAFAPNSKRLASGSGSLDGLVWLWDMSGGEPIQKAGLAGHTAPVEALAFSPDGRLLASGSCDRTVRIWDVSGAQPRERAVLKGHTDYVKALAFAPDSRRIASGSQDGTARVWSIGKIWCNEEAVLRSGAGHVRAVAFAPDGQALALGCMDQSVRLWDIAATAPKESLVLQGHHGVVRVIVSPPEGNALLSAGDRGLVILWDAVAGVKVREWQLPTTMICSMTTTFDGRYLATGSSDGSVVVYRLYPRKSKQRPEPAP
jgi:serine/threonine-protein kinase